MALNSKRKAGGAGLALDSKRKAGASGLALKEEIEKQLGEEGARPRWVDTNARFGGKGRVRATDSGLASKSEWGNEWGGEWSGELSGCLTGRGEQHQQPDTGHDYSQNRQ